MGVGKRDSQPALVVVNRRASRAEEARPRLEKALAEAGIDADVRIPDDPGTIPRIIREAAGDGSCVIVGGGDGTLHHAAPAVMAAGLPLGILPLGTANDLARTLEIPVELPAAAAVIAAGEVRPIDVGRIGDRLFLNVASFGISGRLTRSLDEGEKSRWGIWSYPMRALSAIRGARPFRVELHTDRVEAFRALQVAVANGPSCGAFVTLDESTELDDGLLTVCVIEAESSWRLLALLPHLWRGSARSSEAARVRKCSHVRVQTSRPIEVSADGEIVTRTPAEFGIQPRALRVFVPKEGA